MKFEFVSALRRGDFVVDPTGSQVKIEAVTPSVIPWKDSVLRTHTVIGTCLQGETPYKRIVAIGEMWQKL